MASTGQAARERSRVRILLAVVLTVTFLLHLLVVAEPFGRDQGIFAYIARTMLQGGVPYRDAWDHKTPGLYVIYAVAFSVFGQSMPSLHLLEGIFLTLTAFFVYRTGRRLQSERVGLLGALLYGVAATLLFEWWDRGQAEIYMALTGTLAVLSLLQAVSPRSGPVRSMATAVPNLPAYVLCGIFCGLTIYFKPSGAPLVAGLGVAVLTLCWPSGLRRVTQGVVAFALGFALSFVPLLIYFAANHALVDLYQTIIVFNSYHARIGGNPTLGGILTGTLDFLTSMNILAPCALVGLWVVLRRGVEGDSPSPQPSPLQGEGVEPPLPARERAGVRVDAASALPAAGAKGDAAPALPAAGAKGDAEPVLPAAGAKGDAASALPGAGVRVDAASALPGAGVSAGMAPVLFVLWLIGSAAGIWLQGKFFSYHWSTVLPPLALLAATGIVAIADSIRQVAAREARALAVLLCILVTTIFVVALMRDDLPKWQRDAGYLLGRTSTSDYLANFAHNIDGRDVYSFQQAQQTAQYLDAHSTKDDEVLVWGFQTLVNYLADRRAPTRYIFTYPLTFDRPESEFRVQARRTFLKDLHDRPPLYIVLVTNDVNPLQAVDSYELLPGFPEFQQILQLQYHIETDIGEFHIYGRS